MTCDKGYTSKDEHMTQILAHSLMYADRHAADETDRRAKTLIEVDREKRGCNEACRYRGRQTERRAQTVMTT